MDEEYILRWNDHGVSFFALAEDLLQQELLTDVTIWCGDRVFDAHKLVLCACSPLFKSMLTRLRPQNHPVVFLKDVSPVHFERLLQFMYCGEVRVPNNELEELLATATSLSVRGLANAPHEQQPLPLLNKSPPATNQNKEPAAPPKKRLRRNSEEFQIHHKKSPLSTLDNNRILNNSQAPSSCTPPLAHSRESAIKEEDEPVSPPPQAELVVPLVNDHQPKTSTPSSLLAVSAAVASARISETQRILPPSEPRKTGTCYFCKKSFMKNKQLMNHVCPKKPRGGSGGSTSNSTSSTTFQVSKTSSPT